MYQSYSTSMTPWRKGPSWRGGVGGRDSRASSSPKPAKYNPWLEVGVSITPLVQRQLQKLNLIFQLFFLMKLILVVRKVI